MSKKRVHEIAKELKEKHGIEFDNKQVVTELVSLGYDVKSHSSSLEDDQAVAAVQKIVDKLKPKAAPAPVAAKGFVVRRKVGDNVVATAAAAPTAPLVREAPPAAVVEAPPAPAEPEAPVEVAPPAPEPVVNMPAATDAPVETPVAKPPEVPVVPAAAEPVAPVAAVNPAAVEASAAAVPPTRASAPRARASAPRPGAVTVAPVAAPPPVAVPPMVRTGVGPRASAPRPGVTVRPPLAGAPAARPPIGLGIAAIRAQQSAMNPKPGVPAVVRTVPTATQAVVVSRPLIPIKRITPTQPSSSRYPMAPGRKAIGTGPGAGVREFKVVPTTAPGQRDGFGQRRDADRRGPPGAAGQRREKEKEQSTTSDIKELIFGRSAIPVRGKKRKPTKKGQKTLITQMAEDKKVIKVQEGITVSELSQRMGVKTTDIIRKLMQSGKMATATQTIDVDTAGILATDYGWTVKKVGFEVEDFLPTVEDKPEQLISRPPVVTVMGHVDHGKTSLLDAIRQANVASGEAGGITQHVGAYTVKSSQGDVTFLDTPGHAAFSAMRARGANITDVVVLVVAGDDGVMPQTKEAIQHAQKAEVPIVVAINKMDLPAANPDRVKKELADIGLLAEDWGGETIMVPVSAKTRQGLDLLLENIALQSEVLELKANPDRPATGIILEARLEKGRGPIATVLVQEGTLKKGDALVSGTHYGRVRMMLNDRGELVDTVKPGYSAEIIGLSGVPTAGDVINAVADEKAAKQIADHRILKSRQAEAGKTSRESLDDLLNKQKVAEQKELKIVLKADVSGSLEAVADAIHKLSTKKVKVTIVQKGVGMMTETDIGTAEAFSAVVIGFNSKPESGAEAAAKHKEVKWETFGIIYELLDGVTKMMEDLLDPIRTEKRIGKAEVRSLFNVPKLGTIAGSAVIEGAIRRGATVKVMRANKLVFTGKMASLKRFKDDVKEVTMGYECGIGIEGFSELVAGDVIEAYEIEETRPSLN
ncbi:MAG: translation initiation factor IF-2 [Archangium gephyra]|uniref:Translation initiation factor IF-2 n=1 Tax=Archangium gephyra TaxID=48 RepID=A0A2W5TC37_9BACT|nr:MAG: translation initiation factor IF-2 [Archangium gephyra]